MKDELLFYNAYEEFYKMASTSEAFRDFCIDAYGADFSQDGFSDVKQIEMIIPFIKKNGAHILDIGCGNGKMIKYLGDKTGAHIYGFDYSDNAIMQAKKNNNSDDFCVGVMGEIEYPKESFDVIVAMDSMYFAPDMATFVKQIRNWLKPGGVLFVAYQEGDVMDKTENENTTIFSEAVRTIGWEYEVKNISADSYNMLVKKREVALSYKEKFETEGNGMWGDMLIEQTDYVLQGKERIHLLSGILKCPICGAGMYGNKSIKHKKDGTRYSDYFYYGCKHRNMTRGHKCDYRKQISEEKLDGAVTEVLRKLVSNKKFAGMMRDKIGMEVDTTTLNQEIASCEKTLRQCYSNKDAILNDLDNIDYDDKHYQRRKSDLENRLCKVYDKIEETEDALVEAKAKKRSILAEKVCGDNIYKALIFFDKTNEKMNDAERRDFLTQIIEKVEIHEEEQPNGQWLKSITFKLPIIPHDMEMSLDNGSQIETACLLKKRS